MSSQKTPVILYDRPDGPICFEVQLFYSADNLPEVVEQLIESELSWSWLAEPAHKNVGLIDSQVVDDEPIALTGASKPRLLSDLRHADQDGEGWFITLIGQLNTDRTTVRSKSDLLNEIAKFARQEGGSTEVVIVQIGDSVSDLVFVARNGSRATSALLDAFGLSPSRTEVRPYRRLRGASLETMYRVPTANPERDW